MAAAFFLGISIVQYLSVPRDRLRYYLMSSIFFGLATAIAFVSILSSPELIVSIPLAAMAAILGYSFQTRRSLCAKEIEVVPKIKGSEHQETGQISVILVEDGAPLHYRRTTWVNRMKTLRDEEAPTVSFWSRPFLLRKIRNMTDEEEWVKAQQEREQILGSLQDRLLVEGRNINVLTMSLEDHSAILQRIVEEIDAGSDQVILCPVFLGRRNRIEGLREKTGTLNLEERGVSISFIEYGLEVDEEILRIIESASEKTTNVLAIRRGSPPGWGVLPSGEEPSLNGFEAVSESLGKDNIDVAYRYFRNPKPDEKLCELEESGVSSVLCLPLDMHSSSTAGEYCRETGSENSLECINIAGWQGYPLGLDAMASKIRSSYGR